MKIRNADWPAPANIRAIVTTRKSGLSLEPFERFNVAMHVGDNPEHVAQTREQLMQGLDLTHEPLWLNQTHSTDSIIAGEDQHRDADASISRSPNYPLVVLTADCLPIVLCSKQGTEIAAIHAGWRGLYNGIIENTISKMQTKPYDLMAWIGPAICQKCYEVGDEVYQSFTGKNKKHVDAFTSSNGKWLANLPHMAQTVLELQGVNAVYQSNLCTFESQDEFYSYRRQANTGRIATLIWFNNQL